MNETIAKLHNMALYFDLMGAWYMAEWCRGLIFEEKQLLDLEKCFSDRSFK